MLGYVGPATGAELFAEEAELLPDAVDGRRKRELQAQQQVGPEGDQHETEGPCSAMDEPGPAGDGTHDDREDEQRSQGRPAHPIDRKGGGDGEAEEAEKVEELARDHQLGRA